MPRPLPTFALACAVVSACVPGGPPPVLPAGPGLAAEASPAPAAVAPGGPLRVLYGGPRGETVAATEVALIFDRPMRALGLGPSDPPPPVTLTPAAKGAFHWIGSAALRFDAEAPLPPATAFRVEVPAGARGLDGAALAAPYVMEFSTPRPVLVDSDPAAGAEGVAPESPIVLSFNQRVSEAEIRRAVTIRGGALPAEPLAFSVERQAPDRVQLQPARPLRTNDRVQVLVDASLRGEDGDLPAGTARTIAFSTVGPPTVQSITCQPHPDDATRCDPDNPTVTIELSSPLPGRALAKSVVLDPPIAWNRAEYKDDDAIGYLTIQPEIKPWTTLRVRIDPARGGKGLVDTWGQHPVPATAELRFGNRMSRVWFGLSGVYWGTRAPHDFLAFVSNAPGAELSARPAPLTEILAGLAGAAAPPGRGERSVALPQGRLDETAEDTIHLDELLPRGTRGPVHLLVHRPGGETESREIQLSALALSARVAHGKAAVLVSGIDDGKPVPGASVEVYRVPERTKRSPVVLLGSALTGADGSAAVALSPASPFLWGDRVAVVTRAGDDWSYARLGAPRAVEVVGVMYSERGIYRPGETAHVAGLFRVPGPDGIATPRGAEVKVTLRGSGSTPVFAGRTTLSEFGTFSLDLPLATDLPLNTYYVRADAVGGHAYTRLVVAEYRPTSIAVEATTDAAERVRGQSVTCSAEGRYLHGGGMAGTTASLRVRRSHANVNVPGLLGFSVANERRPSPPSDAAHASRPLDARGIASLSVPLTFPDMTGPEQLTCEVEVSDLDGQALSASAYTTVHPAEIYVALAEPDHRPLLAGETLKLSALAVTPEGQRRSARIHLTAALRETVKGEEKETPLGGCDVTPDKDPAGCLVKLPAKTTPSAEIVVRGEATDARGNPVRASFAVRLDDPPKRTPPAAPASRLPPATPPRQLELHLDQRHYAAGATVHIDLRSPFADPAMAFITIEREGILWQRVVPLPTAGTRVDVPLTPAMLPGGEVAVTAIAGGEARQESAYFEVDAASRELTVSLDTRGEVHAPGEEVDVDVTVKDATGAPARADVTLYAADEGSLSLIYYGMPNPHGHLFARAESSATGYEAHPDRMKVGRFGFHRTQPPSVRMGATQVSNHAIRGDFRQTAVFLPHLVTDAEGHVRRRVKMPDGLSAYRFMAVSVAVDDRTGTAQATVRTRQPLMARASLPRVIRAGDRFEASVVVSTSGLPEGDVSIEAEAEGLVLEKPGPLSVHALAGAPVEARVLLRADKPGPAKLTVRARLGEASDAMTLSGQVVAPTLPESAAVDGETAGAVAERIASTAGLRPDYGGLAVTVSSGPLAGLAGGIRQLVEYPYGCTEQTVSAMVPLLALRDLARAIEADLPADVGAALDQAVKRLAENQRADGGFGLWSTSGHSQPWVTAWALWGLGEARRRGVAVPDRVEARAWAYFKETLAVSASGPADRLVLAAFLFDLSAEDGHADPALASRVAAQRARLSPSGRALLLHGLAVAGLSPEIRADLHRELEAFVRLDGNLAQAVLTDPSSDLLDSDARATAMILRAFVADTPSHPLVQRLARGLLSQRRDGRFRTTQEAAWALIALDALRRAAPPPAAIDARIFLGQAPVGEAHLAAAARRFEIPMPALLSQGGAPLTLAASGGTLHYEARLRYARAVNPTTPEEAGLVVRRTARPLGPGPRAPGTFVAGELVEVEVDVLTPSPRHFVAVESPLPGGLEAADAGLRTAGTWIHGLEATPHGARREDRDDRVVYFVDDLPAGLTVFRYVARATTAGTFVTPPARAEEMYVPETHGRTAGETVVVTAR